LQKKGPQKRAGLQEERPNLIIVRKLNENRNKQVPRLLNSKTAHETIRFFRKEVKTRKSEIPRGGGGEGAII